MGCLAEQLTSTKTAVRAAEMTVLRQFNGTITSIDGRAYVASLNSRSKPGLKRHRAIKLRAGRL
jgi:hypothetical protein